MKITPQDIHHQEFTRGMRGYAVEEVDAFLQRVADELERVLDDNTKLRDQVKTLEAGISEYRRMEKNLERTLMTAQEASDAMAHAAEEKRDLAIREAELRGQEIIAEAQRLRDGVKGELIALRQQKATAVAELRALLQAQLHMLEEYEHRAGTAIAETAAAPALEEPLRFSLADDEPVRFELPEELDLDQ